MAGHLWVQVVEELNIAPPDACLFSGLEAAFQGAGRLSCGPRVSVVKGPNDRAHLVLEGALCDEFFRVREVIYRQFNVA